MNMGEFIFPEIDTMLIVEEAQILGDDWNTTVKAFDDVERELSTLGSKDYYLKGVINPLNTHQNFWYQVQITVGLISGGVI